MNDQENNVIIHQPTEASPSTPTKTGEARRGFVVGGLAALVAVAATACSSDLDDAQSTPSGEPSTSTPQTTSSAPSDTTASDGTSQPPADGDASGTPDSVPSIPVSPGDVEGGRDPNNPTAKEPSAELAKDLPTAAFAAGLEILAVNTYRRALTAAGAGQLGVVPPAVAEFVETVMGHHQAALDQWNRVLAGGGQPEVAAPTSSLQPTVDDAFAVVSDVAGAARLALMLEEIAAATYLAAIPNLASSEAIALVASIYPIDMQHSAVLRFVMGEYPVPDVFGKVDLAASPA